MVNDRLRTAMEAAGLTTDAVATQLDVDAKTVERWIATGRTPYPRHRVAFARLVGSDAGELWPSAREVRPRRPQDLVRLYPSRGSVPTHLWFELLEASNRSVDLLFYSALFLSDGHAELANAIRRAASRGARVRILVGNPRSAAVIARGREEGIGHDVASRVRMTLHYLDGVDQVDGVQVRGHSTTLYNSIYRFDDDMLVNAHTYGAAAVESPVLQIRPRSARPAFRPLHEELRACVGRLYSPSFGLRQRGDQWLASTILTIPQHRPRPRSSRRRTSS
jgi:hypothetical protein